MSPSALMPCSAVATAPGLAAVWKYCSLPEDPVEWGDVLARSTVKPMILFQDYADRTLRDVLDALDVLRGFSDLLLRKDDVSHSAQAASLRQSFVDQMILIQQQLSPKTDQRAVWAPLASPLLSGVDGTVLSGI